MPVPVVLSGVRSRPFDLMALFLGNCIGRVANWVKEPDVALLECLRPRLLWEYFEYPEIQGEVIEKWVLHPDSPCPFPFPVVAVPGFGRIVVLFGRVWPKGMLRQGYYWTLAQSEELPIRHRRLLMEMARGRVEGLTRHQRDYMWKLYKEGIKP
ncbi:hypothetical protein [Thermus sp. FJN-A]